MKNFLLLSLILGSLNLQAQKMSQAEINFAHEFLYSFQELLTSEQCPSKKLPFDVETWFQKNESDNDSIQAVLDFAAKNISWRTSQGPSDLGFPMLARVETLVPARVNYEFIEGVNTFRTLFLHVEDWQLKRSKGGQSVKVGPQDFYTYSSSSGGIGDESNGTQNYDGKISTSYIVWNDKNSDPAISGTAQVEIKYLKEYRKIEISKEEIGKTFSIAGYDFVLIDIIDNKIIHKRLNEKSFPSYSDISLLNVNREKNELILPNLADNQTTVLNYPFGLGSECQSGYSTQDIPVNLYEYLANNPDASFEELQREFPIKDEDPEMREVYTILQLPTTIEKLIIYEPVYQVGRSVEARYKEDRY